MMKRQRITLGGYAYHVLNRANGRLRIFRKAGDFLAFERILAEITRSVKRGRPLGGRSWTQMTAAKLRLESTLRPRGRPKKATAQKGTADL